MDRIKDIGEVAKITKDILPETVKEADSALSTIVGLFNNVVLYPIKKANVEYKYKLEQFEIDMQEKISKIPNDYIKKPELNIIGPALEALKYTFDDKCLREMYINLLSNSMDLRRDKMVHPSYVDIIKQMDDYDAKLFEYLSKKGEVFKVINPRIHIVGTDQVLRYVMPQWFILYFEQGYDIFLTSASLCRLAKFGLIDLMYDRTTSDEEYVKLEHNNILQTILEREKLSKPQFNLEIQFTQSAIQINDFGKAFAAVCVP